MSPVFHALDDLDLKLSSQAPPIAYINLGVPEDFGIKYAPHFFAALRADLPKLKLTLHRDCNKNLIKMLQKGQLCSIVIADDGFALESFYVHTIYEDEMGFFVSPQLKERNFDRLIEDKGLG